MDGAVEGELVRFEPMRERKPGRQGARVTERIGHPQPKKSVSLIAIHSHGIRDRFGEDVLSELDVAARADDGASRGPDPHSARHHRSEDAKDHDDAVWAEPDTDPANEGGAIVIVAIADVSFYVRLRHGARQRGGPARQFGLFPGPVVPMLPEKLSNDLCSLRDSELRPCLAVRMTFDAQRQEALTPLRARHDALGGQALLSGGAGRHRRQAE